MSCRVNNPLFSVLRVALITILLCNSGWAQYTLSGKVVDAATREPLPFVNIVINHNVSNGVTCDINGRFHLIADAPIDSITCSYVGYQSRTLAASTAHEPLIIELYEADIVLGEIVVRAGENPANRIIRKVIANKELNNPERIESFRYLSYNKVVYDFLYEDEPDTATQKTLDGIFGGGHIFLMESVTERNFIRPDNSEEKILGVKVSGFKEASFAPLATDLQPFSFYKDNIPILDVTYLNPISPGSLGKYEFHIRDTLFQGTDTVFILSYAPLEGKNFEALTGLLYINTNRYAIQNVTAKPFSRGFIDVTIQQQYQWIDDRQWFPEQLKFELILHPNASTTVGVKAGGISYIDSVRLDLPLRKKDFALDAVTMDTGASSRDSIYWLIHRPVALNPKEVTTYAVLDSLGEKYGFDQKLKLMERLGQNRIPWGPIDFDLSKILVYNKFEGIRLGMGLYTNDAWIRNVSTGGYFGYGFHDHLWKYGGEITWTADPAHELKWTLRHDNTVEEVGKSYLTFFRPRQFDFRAFLASEMDRIQETSIAFSSRLLKYMKVYVALANTRRDPQYSYTFLADPESPLSRFTNTTLQVHLRYAFKEKLIWSMGQRISMGSRYPVISASYSHGFKGWLNGDLTYTKLEGRIEKSFYIRNLGTSRLELSAGYIDRPVPYSLLFTGEGSYIRNWSVLVRNSFQTITPYAFLSDTYVDFHYSHNFGSLLWRVGNWKPSITLHQNCGWGTLSHPEHHQGVTFLTKEKGLFETGLQLDNIVKIKYLNVSYLGFGAGMFYRYGAYTLPKFSDNVAFTFSMTVTTR